jgi:ATP-dependent exoDNAse (exonuclease V) beta subunit
VTPSAREERAARGAAVHALLEWSQAHDWTEPSEELVRQHAAAAGLDTEDDSLATELLAPVRGWLGSELRARIGAEGAWVRAEAPILLGIGGTVLRGAIDLLVEREGERPLVVDYKTDALGNTSPAERAAEYEVQRTIYALAVAEARDAPEVEVAYVFLERPQQPVLSTVGPAEMVAGHARLEQTIARIAGGEFPVAPPERRDWSLCRGCPALRGLCSGPRSVDG